MSKHSSLSLRRINHRWLPLRSSILSILLLLRFHLLILLRQRAATTEAGNKAVATAVALNIILATHIAPADHLEDTLEGAE